MIAARQIAFGRGAKKEEPPAYGGLCFTAEAANSSVKLTAVGSAPVVTLIKSFDGVNWDNYAVGDVIELPSIGKSVYLAAGEGGNNAFAASPRAYHKFVINGLVASSGDITSILNFDCAQTTLANSCYSNMFNGCTGLTSAPKLPATTLATYCYQNMFYGCKGLTSAPELPATTLATYCYQNMFRGCTGLTSAPELPATTLAANCYQYMFSGCINMALIKAYFTEWSSQTKGWVNNVSPTGTFICPTALGTNETIKRDIDGCPQGWTVINEG